MGIFHEKIPEVPSTAHGVSKALSSGYTYMLPNGAGGPLIAQGQVLPHTSLLCSELGELPLGWGRVGLGVMGFWAVGARTRPPQPL